MTRRRTCAAALALLVALSAVACEEPCDGGDTSCVDGTSLLVCQSIRHGHAVEHEWQQQACPNLNPICVAQETDPNATPQREGVCVSSPTPSPECSSQPEGYCSAGVRYACSHEGNPIVVEQCASGCSTSTADCAP